MENDKVKVKLTGLWENTTAKGEKYFSGSLGAARLLMFRNSYKEDGDNQPDYNLFLVPKEKKDGESKGYPAPSPNTRSQEYLEDAKEVF